MKVGFRGKSQLKKTDLKDFRENWSLCYQCSSCYYPGPITPHNWLELPPPEWSSPLHKCPSFEYFKFKAYTAVGRGNLAVLVFEDNQFPVTDDLIKIVYTCTSCGMCSEICPRVRPLTAIWALREELVRRGVQLPAPLKKIDANIQKFDNLFGLQRPPRVFKGVPTSGEDVYFAGCVARFQEPKVFTAVVQILKAAGLTIAHLKEEERCCGFIPGHNGNTQLLEEKALQNVEALNKAGAKRVIASCAHCYKTLKMDYPLIVGELPFEVVHISQLLANLIEGRKIKFTTELEKKVTYHDPCFLGRHGKVYDEPRKILESIKGIKVAEMEFNRRWAHCCGSGAKITSGCYPEFAAAMTKERLAEGREVADTIVTACTTCFRHMAEAKRKEGLKLEIYDLPILVAEAIGIRI